MLNINKTTKRKRVSKKNKSSWRKHVDITDVDNFLEEQRFQERLGKPLELVPDNELFTLDTAPSTEIKLTSKQEKRKQLRESIPKYCAILQPLTKVPDPISKRNRVRTKEERKNAILKKKELLNRAKGKFKLKDVRAIKDKEVDAATRAGKPSKFDFDKDIWSTDEKTLKNAPDIDSRVASDEWIVGDAERHVLRGPGKAYRKVPEQRKPSIVEAVEIPHPGTSYNPSFEDHQDLLRQIVEKEKKIIKEEKHLDRVTRQMFRKVTAEERDNAWITEMAQGLDKPEEPEVVSDEEYKSINPPVKNKEKSVKQRRKQKEEQQKLEAIRKAKEEKKKIADIYKLKFINKSIEKTNKKIQMLREKKLKKLEYKKKEAKRLGSTKFEEPDVEFNMGADITGNLRSMKKEGNLLNDRFKSLQKRNVIEPTLMRMKKTAKVKKFTKAGFKGDWKMTVARPSSVN